MDDNRPLNITITARRNTDGWPERISPPDYFLVVTDADTGEELVRGKLGTVGGVAFIPDGERKQATKL